MNDICINRHKNNPSSNIANSKVDKANCRDFIYNFIKENGAGYLKQLARAMGKQKNEISFEVFILLLHELCFYHILNLFH